MDLPQHKAGAPVKPDSPPDHDDDCEGKLLKTLADIADEAQRVKDHWVRTSTSRATSTCTAASSKATPTIATSTATSSAPSSTAWWPS